VPAGVASPKYIPLSLRLGLGNKIGSIPVFAIVLIFALA
jgi:hypothetical protein